MSEADCDVLIYDGASARQHHALIKDDSPLSKIISIPIRLINNAYILKVFPVDSFSADMNIYVRRNKTPTYARYFVYGEILLISTR